MEKTYFEIKITFIHILIMLVAIILIGIFLFYMGYKAGLRSNASIIGKENEPVKKEKVRQNESTQIIEEKPAYSQTTKKPAKAIESEEKLYSQKSPIKKETKAEKSTVTASFFSIRVGAFSSQANAQKYAGNFQKAGYHTKIIPPDPEAKANLYYVLVGQYPDYEQAKSEKEKLEKLENKKFLIVPYR